jgi:hypothetical protein
MHERLAAIGLPCPDHEAMEARAIELAPFGEYEGRDDGGSRIVWRDASGAGLSILSDADHVLQCIVPFFSSPPRALARVHQVVEDKSSRFADRVVVDVLDLHGKRVFSTALLVHDLSSSRQLIVHDRNMELGLSAFLEKVEHVDGKVPLQVDARINQPGLPDPHIDAITRVLSVDSRINRATGAPFVHMKLDLNGLPVEAVCPLQGMTTDEHGFARGQLIRVTALLVGALEPGRNDTTIPRLPGSR